MTAAVLLDHVSSYAAAVRTYLRDLSPEQVDDLTDGLEADLVEALEDPLGPAGTVETAAPDGSAAVIDLTRRFGPAADYAAELRAAAGLAPALPWQAPTRERGYVRLGAAVRRRWATVTGPVTRSRHWPAVRDLLVAMTPVWWLIRGWVWFVLAMVPFGAVVGGLRQMFVPESFAAWLVLGGLALLSVQWGRGLLTVDGRGRTALRLADRVAVVLAVPFLIGMLGLTGRLTDTRVETVYVETGYEVPAEDGVRVEGQLVSNLFVYDAEGYPLTDVQIFDDRGRPVRTTYDDGYGSWSLPGVAEPWTFASVTDVDGRTRWNVYPLRGGPSSAWQDGPDGLVLVDGRPELPPRPFAKAPAVVDADADADRDADAAQEAAEAPDADQTSAPVAPTPAPAGG